MRENMSSDTTTINACHGTDTLHYNSMDFYNKPTIITGISNINIPYHTTTGTGEHVLAFADSYSALGWM